MTEEQVIKKLLKSQHDLDEYTLKQIATRLNSTKGLGLVDLFDIAYFAMIFGIMSDIEAKVISTRQMQVKELDRLMSKSAVDAYNDMKPLYEDGGKLFVPYKKNQEVIDAVAKESNTRLKQFDDVLKGVGYYIPNDNDTKMFKSPSDTYQHIANLTKNEELNNPFGYDVWSRKIVRGLLRDGLKVYNYNQDTHRYKQQNSYSFIRNFVKDSVYRVCQSVYNVVANQVGIDGIEISVHTDCALDHLPVQGRQFAIREFHKMQANDSFIDIQGNAYAPLDRAIGTWNCRHFVYPIIIGKTEPRHSEEQLQEIKERTINYKQVTTMNGEALYMSLNDYNRHLRNLQDKINNVTIDLHVAEKLGDKWLIDYYKTKLFEYKSALSSLVEQK